MRNDHVIGYRRSYHVFLETNFVHKRPEIREEVVIRNNLKLRAQVILNSVVNLLRVHEQRGAIKSHDGVRKEDYPIRSADFSQAIKIRTRVEVDISPAEIEEPGHLVEHSDNHSIRLLLLQFFANTSDLVLC